MNFYRTAGACALALTAVVLSATMTLAASLPEDFESYNTDEQLQSVFTFQTDNAQIELDLTGGVGDSKAFLFTGDNDSEPFFTSAELQLADNFSLFGIDQVTLQIKPLEDTANASFLVQLKDEFGTRLTENIPIFSLGGLSTNSFTTYTINTSKTDGGLRKIAFFLEDNGTTGSASLLIDNIMAGPVVPEPASLALFAVASAGMICFRRRSRS